jgi:hypothetical protein
MIIKVGDVKGHFGWEKEKMMEIEVKWCREKCEERVGQH